MFFIQNRCFNHKNIYVNASDIGFHSTINNYPTNIEIEAELKNKHLIKELVNARAQIKELKNTVQSLHVISNCSQYIIIHHQN